MKKGKETAFFCKECGYETSKWLGQCPGCKEWNTLVEEPVVKREKGRMIPVGDVPKPTPLKDITADDEERLSTGFSELDRVLGGGIVAGSLVLIGGDPGIGKSTILLQMCKNLSDCQKNILYI